VEKTIKRRGNTNLLFRSEVVDNVEELADLLRGLALDHVGDGLATDVAVAQSARDRETENVGAYSKDLMSR
jgi:hypothetical protein